METRWSSGSIQKIHENQQLPAGPGPGSLHVPLLGSVESLVPGGRSPRSAASQLMVDKVNLSEK